MSGRVPPKALEPTVSDITHHTVNLNWQELINRLKEVFNTTQDGRINSEVQQRLASKSDWNTIYTGYDGSCTVKNLLPDALYHFRLRFKNKHGSGQFSDELKIKTEKQPLTGEHIHKAIRMEDKEELINILKKGEANIDAQDNLDFTPLMAAVQKGLVDIVKILLEWNADIEKRNKSGKTALMLASFCGQWDCVEALLDGGASIDSRDESGLGVLHYAVDGEKKDMVKKLIYKGANVNAVDNNLKWTPLIRCAGLKNNGNVSVAHELIKGEAKIDFQDVDGKTALHNAIINNHAKLVEYLLDKGASLTIKTENGHNALTLATSLDQRACKVAIEDYLERNTK